MVAGCLLRQFNPTDRLDKRQLKELREQCRTLAPCGPQGTEHLHSTRYSTEILETEIWKRVPATN